MHCFIKDFFFFFFLLLQSLINKLRISWANTWIGEYFYNYFLSYPNQRTNQKVFQHILCIHICLLFPVLIWYWFAVINSPQVKTNSAQNCSLWFINICVDLLLIFFYSTGKNRRLLLYLFISIFQKLSLRESGGK